MSNKEEEVVEGPFKSNPQEEAIPLHDYVFHLKSGENKIAKGYLALTQSAVAVGTGAGDLSLVVPLTELSFVEELPEIAGRA